MEKGYIFDEMNACSTVILPRLFETEYNSMTESNRIEPSQVESNRLMKKVEKSVATHAKNTMKLKKICRQYLRRKAFILKPRCYVDSPNMVSGYPPSDNTVPRLNVLEM